MSPHECEDESSIQEDEFKNWFQPSDLLKVSELALKADLFLPSALLLLAFNICK